MFGASLPTAAPEQAGLASARLNRINTIMREHIQSGRLTRRFRPDRAQRQGRIPGNWGDYKPDTIVRMYSMTKAVTGVAAMTFTKRAASR